jgi:serine/threonine-protein kinase
MVSARQDAGCVSGTDLENEDPLGVVGTTLFDRYRVVRLVGRGGQGAVYEAEDERLKRSIAIKFLERGARDATALQRFQREAEILAKLSHPGIVQVHDVATHADGKTPIMIMELVQGESLGTRVGGSRGMGWREVFGLGAQAAKALAAAHKHGILHRDVKPDNLIVTADGILKVLDFGIAQLLADSYRTEDGHGPRRRVTAADTRVGSAGYMSPEQLLGGAELDGRSDVYSLGVVLYRALTGKPLWETHDPGQIAALVQTESPRDVREHAAGLPDHAAEVVRRAIEVDRERRFPTMEAMHAAIVESLGRMDEEVAPRVHVDARVVHPVSRGWSGLVLLVGAVLALAAVFAAWDHARRNDDASGRSERRRPVADLPGRHVPLPASEQTAGAGLSAADRQKTIRTPTKRPSAPAPPGGQDIDTPANPFVDK